MAWLRFIGKVLLILVLAVPLTVLALLYLSKRGQGRGEVLRGIAGEAKEALDEAKHIAVVSTKAARKDEIALKQRLEHVKCIGDKRKRREALLELYLEVTR